MNIKKSLKSKSKNKISSILKPGRTNKKESFLKTNPYFLNKKLLEKKKLINGNNMKENKMRALDKKAIAKIISNKTKRRSSASKMLNYKHAKSS